MPINYAHRGNISSSFCKYLEKKPPISQFDENLSPPSTTLEKENDQERGKNLEREKIPVLPAKYRMILEELGYTVKL